MAGVAVGVVARGAALAVGRRGIEDRCRPWPDRAWPPWQALRLPAWRLLVSGEAGTGGDAQRGLLAESGQTTSYRGLDLWRKTRRFCNGAPFRKLIDDHPTRKPAALYSRTAPVVDAADRRHAPASHGGWLHTAHFLTSASQLEHLPALRAARDRLRRPLERRQVDRDQHADATDAPGLRIEDARAARSTSTCSASASRRSTTPCWPTSPATATPPCPSEAKLRWQRVMGQLPDDAREPARRGADVRPAPRPHRTRRDPAGRDPPAGRSKGSSSWCC